MTQPQREITKQPTGIGSNRIFHTESSEAAPSTNSITILKPMSGKRRKVFVKPNVNTLNSQASGQ